MTVCPCCASDPTWAFKEVNSYTLRKCVGCGVEFCWPMPSEWVLKAFYEKYSDPLASSHVSDMNASRNIAALRMLPIQRILDFGCGEDQFASAARIMGFDAIGEDRYRQPVVSSADKFDLITMWGVLEHITLPYEDLLFLRRRLAEHGRVALTTVTTESPIPYRHKPPEHTLYFTRASIEALAKRAGFKIAEYRPYTMMQDSDVYLDVLLRTMPDKYQALVTHSMPQYVEIPTNEVFVVMEKA